jgi:hypothetical protein
VCLLQVRHPGLLLGLRARRDLRQVISQRLAVLVQHPIQPSSSSSPSSKSTSDEQHRAFYKSNVYLSLLVLQARQVLRRVVRQRLVWALRRPLRLSPFRRLLLGSTVHVIAFEQVYV